MNSVLVSLVLPTYNVGEFLAPCLDSVLAQTYKNLEIIIVDDGSTDQSGVIADAYAAKDDRFVVIHQKNAGVCAARNKGIDSAKGDYISFVDPDDILKPDYVEYLLNLCLRHDAEVGVCSQLFTVNRPWQRDEKIEVISGEEGAVRVLYGHIQLASYSKMFRRSFLNEHQIRFFEELRVGEGFNFNVYAYCFAKRIAVSTHKVYFYRLNNISSCMSHFNINKVKDALYAIRFMKEHLVLKTKRLEEAVDFADWDTHGGMYDWMQRAGVGSEYPDVYNDCKSVTRRHAFRHIFAPTRLQTRIKAVLSVIHPILYPLLMRAITKKTRSKS